MTENELLEAKKGEKALYVKAKEPLQTANVAVFDEIFPAVSAGILEKNDVISLIKEKPQALELVLTGRGAFDESLALADYVSDIKSIKHPYSKGISARPGIEY